MAEDPHIKQAEQAAAAAEPDAEARFADLFDIRRIIAGLFLVYGVVLVILGFSASDAEIERAAGVNINLWGGLGLIVFALIMLGWALLRPVGRQIAASPRNDDEE